MINFKFSTLSGGVYSAYGTTPIEARNKILKSYPYIRCWDLQLIG